MTTLDLGPQLPKVLSASLPWQDEQGLWVNLEIEYNGLCQATVETQVRIYSYVIQIPSVVGQVTMSYSKT